MPYLSGMGVSIEQEIARIEATLNAGARSVRNDAQSVEFDFDALRRRLAELRQQQNPQAALVRPPVFRCDLSGSF
jgi:hypothetical protein